nr:probable purine permease 10 isoform X2 [Ipomoea batatas]
MAVGDIPEMKSQLPPGEEAMEENDNKNAVVNEQSRKFWRGNRYKWWAEMSMYSIFLLSSQSVGTLLGRLYFDKARQRVRQPRQADPEKVHHRLRVHPSRVGRVRVPTRPDAARLPAGLQDGRDVPPRHRDDDLPVGRGVRGDRGGAVSGAESGGGWGRRWRGLRWGEPPFWGCLFPPVLAVFILNDKMNGVKVVSMVLAIWGFVSYIYQHYLDDLKAKAKAKAVEGEEEVSQVALVQRV